MSAGPEGRALVTGATGFIGVELCASLHADGVALRRVSRGPSPAGAPGEALRGDICDPAIAAAAVRRASTVYHLAGRVHQIRDAAADPLAEFRRVNVEGTTTLLEAAARAGVETFIFVSSVKAVGEGGDELWTEETPPRPADPYGMSKLEAEERVLELGARTGVRVAVLRLPLVYGPGMKANMLRLWRLVDRGVPLPFGAIANRRSMAYVGNVVAALRAAAATPATGGERFFVTDADDLSTPRLVREIAWALGRPARLLPVPPALFRLAGRAGDLLGGAAPAGVDSAAVGRLLGSLAVDPAKLRHVAGFTPPFSVREGMERTAAWYRGAGGRMPA